MSLEVSIAALTAAIQENTEVQRSLLSKVDGASTSDAGTAEVSGGVRERGKPAPGSGRTRRTKEEIAEDDAAEAAEGKAGTTTTTTTTTSAVSFDDLKAGLGGWLSQFAKPEDKTNPDGTHPEVLARRDALKKVLVKLTGNDDAKLPMIEADAEKIGKLHNWLENTAKTADKGHGAGRLAADPVATDNDEAEDDGLGI